MLNRYIKYIAARHHVAGQKLNDALFICRLALSKGFSTTLSAWTRPDEKKKDVADKYIEIINTITGNNLDSYLSLKPSALDFDTGIFEYIVKNLPSDSVRIHFDSLSPDLANRTITYFKEVRAMYGNIGYTIPARWQRSLEDAEEIAGMNVPVRIVKGQWQDPDDYKIKVKENFLSIIRLLKNRVPMIAVATHDSDLAEKAIDILAKSDTNFELEQFFSLPFIGKSVQLHFKYKIIPVRFYIAYGEPYLPYNLRTLNERPAVLVWFLRDIISQKIKFDFKHLTNVSLTRIRRETIL